MERQLASLTGLVKKALHTGVASSPLPEHIPLAPPPAVVAAAAAASGNANSREPATNSNRNSASNDFLQVPTSSSYKTPGKWDFRGLNGVVLARLVVCVEGRLLWMVCRVAEAAFWIVCGIVLLLWAFLWASVSVFL